MKPDLRVRSIADQILDELFQQLSLENEIIPGLIDDLRRLAKSGKLVDGEEIVRVINSRVGGDQ